MIGEIQRIRLFACTGIETLVCVMMCSASSSVLICTLLVAIARQQF